MGARTRGSDVGGWGYRDVLSTSPARVVCDAPCPVGTVQSQGMIYPNNVELRLTMKLLNLTTDQYTNTTTRGKA